MTRALLDFHQGNYLEAARRQGDARLFSALAAERVAARPGSPWVIPVSAAAWRAIAGADFPS